MTGKSTVSELVCQRVDVSASCLVSELVGLSASWRVSESSCQRVDCQRVGLSARQRDVCEAFAATKRPRWFAATWCESILWLIVSYHVFFYCGFYLDQRLELVCQRDVCEAFAATKRPRWFGATWCESILWLIVSYHVFFYCGFYLDQRLTPIVKPVRTRCKVKTCEVTEQTKTW